MRTTIPIRPKTYARQTGGGSFLASFIFRLSEADEGLILLKDEVGFTLAKLRLFEDRFDEEPPRLT